MNDKFRDKKDKYEEMARKATIKYKEEMKVIKKVIKAIEDNCKIEDNDDLETIIFKKYLEVENVKKVADYVNELGHRIKTNSWVGQRKYIGNDITEILTNRKSPVEKKLKDVVQFLQDKNYEAMLKKWV